MLIDRALAKASFRTGRALQDVHGVNYRTLRCACYRGLIGGLGAMRRMSAMRREDAHDVSYRTLVSLAGGRLKAYRTLAAGCVA